MLARAMAASLLASLLAPAAPTWTAPVATSHAGQPVVTQVRTLPTSAKGLMFIPLALASDGGVLGTMSAPPNGTDLGRLQLGRMTSRGAFLPSLTTSGRQAVAAASSGRARAFLTTTSTSLDVADWQVYAGTTGRLRLIASSTRLTPGRTPPGPDNAPITTDGRTVYWSGPQFLHQSNDPDVAGTGFRSDIFSGRIDGSGRPRRLVRGAFMPAATTEGLWYVREPAAAPELRHARPEIRFRSTRGVDRRVIVVSGRRTEIGALCVSRDRLAWTTTNGRLDTVHVRDRRRGRTRTVTTRIGAHSTSLACGEGFVAWGAGSDEHDFGEYLLTGSETTPLRIGTAHGGAYVFAAGAYVAWGTIGRGGVIETRKGRVLPRY